MSGDKTLRAIADVYERYNISDREDVLVSTWGMNEADAREQIRNSSTPERAAELIKASDELKAIVQNLIDELSAQIDGTKFQNVADFGALLTTEFIETVAKPASKYIYPNDKLSNKLQEITIDGETTQLIDAKDANMYVTLDFDDAAELTDLDKKNISISEFDKQIQEAVISLMCAGNKCMSEHMIYKTLTQSNGKTSDKWRQRIQASMRKFGSVYITVDFSELIRYYPEYENLSNYLKRTKLLNFNEIYMKTKNGNKVLVYELLDNPIMYTIANVKNQIGSIPIKALESDKLKNTPENTVLKNYLLKRIDQMKKGKLSNDILFETIYKKTGSQTKKEQRTIRENTDKMLLELCASKLIAGYNIITSGRSPVKVQIQF